MVSLFTTQDYRVILLLHIFDGAFGKRMKYYVLSVCVICLYVFVKRFSTKTLSVVHSVLNNSTSITSIVEPDNNYYVG